ncbi:hypothetical protein [Stieleria varia]|uniref:SMP-30/Gluconolaconase/LRE-like region n=1 Tax=Stieleria varia TaxID=2528005 RepID=A0A5C5ZZT2_9BACT|nr:hypothetical protein [Stieleria varia]TWT92666.1 hypothetical protein Pla52n_60310 [Stieleria varia]
MSRLSLATIVLTAGWFVSSVLLAQDQSVDAVVQLHCDALTESSGIGFSHRNADRFWTHNDSGDKPRLFAFDTAGRQTGVCRISDAKSIDWEAMASYVDQGPRLLVADCGDNDEKRKFITMYLFDEPNPDQQSKVEIMQTLRVRFPDGPHNCEAVAVDTQRRQILLATKEPLLSRLYTVPLPGRTNHSATSEQTASAVGQIVMPMVTGMDINRRTGEIWMTSYFHACRLPRPSATATLAEQLVKYPAIFELPKLSQIEAIGLDSEGHAWVTSEGSPAKITRIKKPK